MSFVVGTKAQIRAIRTALNVAEGLPLRGVAVGMAFELPAEPDKDAQGNVLPTPGFTTECTLDPDEAGTQAAVEIPAALEKYLGTRLGAVTLPALRDAAAEDALPAAIKSAREAKRSPLPLEGRPVGKPQR
jgi:hypothetical protein